MIRKGEVCTISPHPQQLDNLAQTFLNRSNVTLLGLTKLIGKFSVVPVTLQHRYLQVQQIQKFKTYCSIRRLNGESLEETAWWKDCSYSMESNECANAGYNFSIAARVTAYLFPIFSSAFFSVITACKHYFILVSLSGAGTNLRHFEVTVQSFVVSHKIILRDFFNTTTSYFCCTGNN